MHLHFLFISSLSKCKSVGRASPISLRCRSPPPLPRARLEMSSLVPTRLRISQRLASIRLGYRPVSCGTSSSRARVVRQQRRHRRRPFVCIFRAGASARRRRSDPRRVAFRIVAPVVASAPRHGRTVSTLDDLAAHIPVWQRDKERQMLQLLFIYVLSRRRNQSCSGRRPEQHRSAAAVLLGESADVRIGTSI